MATETVETVTIQGDGMTASLLVWRRFHKPMPGLVERIYEINPSLALSGPFLAHGAVVRIPIPVAADAVTQATPIRLWE